MPLDLDYSNLYTKRLCVINYLWIAKKHVGILVNFNTDSIDDGIFRKVNGN